MPPTKRTTSSSSQDSLSASDPVADRPDIAAVYGVPKGKKGLLPWSHVTERMEKALYYWVSTVSPAGRPHASPVDGLWLDGALYFGGDPSTRRNRNLESNPAACVHLENGMDVVILYGEAEVVKSAGKALNRRLAEMTNAKYGYGVPVESYDATGSKIFRPSKVIAWSNGFVNATRWRFP